MNKDNHLIWEAFQNKLPGAGPDAALRNTGAGENAENAQQFTVVSGGVDNTSDVGIDINPADHIYAHSLKDAAEETLGEMQGDEDFDDTFPEEYREYVKDIFMMSNDSGDFIAILPGHLNEDQIFTKLVDVRDNNSENAESADEKKERVQRGWQINKDRWAKWKKENPEAAAKHAAKKAGKSENAEQYEQNRIVGNDVVQDDQSIGEFLGDSYSSKLTLHGKEMFMPGAPYAQTVNQGTHMGLWFKNKRHKLIVKDASKWKEFLSDIVATGDDKYWDGKKMYQHDHIGDEIAATNEYWTKKIAAGADQRAENAEGISFKKGDSVYFNDPDYPSYKNIVFQIRDLHGEDANLWSDQLPSSGKPFWVKIKNLRKAR